MNHPSQAALPRRLVLVALGIATVLGAWALRFCCDDAFITFRYVANAHAGHGLVWNPPPFAPVEGYTGFAWALLLWAVWSWFGVEPPDSANVLSMLFGVGQFVVVAWAALRVRDRDGNLLPDGLGLLALATIVGNRSFLQWMTSGLETAMFNLAFLGWVLWAFRRDDGRARWLAVWSAAAAVAALTRPDGLLLVAVTGAVATFALVRGQRSVGTTCAGLLPLGAVLAHVAWRLSFYGEWLPNTYYAKVLAAWPEAGARYLACFAIEHGTWIVPLVALPWLFVELRRAPGRVLRWPLERPAAVAAVACVLFHVGYYIVKVGGDHFEYRVLSQLVPLSVLAVAAMAARIGRGRVLPLLALVGIGVASTVGWLHFALTRDLPSHGFRPIAARLPAAVAPVAHWYDRQQAWLLFHFIGLRCDKHRQMLELFRSQYPSRLVVEHAPDDFPVAAVKAVGLAGWCLPNCAIVDLYGLNDWVIARTPAEAPVAPHLAGAERITRMREIVASANLDHDDRLDEPELRRVLAGVSGSETGGEKADFLVEVALAMHARTHARALTIAEAERMGLMMIDIRLMAHEHRPPPGYVEAFEPNVEVEHGVAVVRPRSRPLTDERIREIERTWRQRVRDRRP